MRVSQAVAFRVPHVMSAPGKFGVRPYSRLVIRICRWRLPRAEVGRARLRMEAEPGTMSQREWAARAPTVRGRQVSRFRVQGTGPLARGTCRVSRARACTLAKPANAAGRVLRVHITRARLHGVVTPTAWACEFSAIYWGFRRANSAGIHTISYCEAPTDVVPVPVRLEIRPDSIQSNVLRSLGLASWSSTIVRVPRSVNSITSRLNADLIIAPAAIIALVVRVRRQPLRNGESMPSRASFSRQPRCSDWRPFRGAEHDVTSRPCRLSQ